MVASGQIYTTNLNQVYTGIDVVPSVTIASPISNTIADTTKWVPNIDWGTAVSCEYSYDNYVTMNTLDCAENGTDLPRPTAGDHTLYIRAIDSHGGLTEKSVTYTYDNTVPTYTMCGADLLDEDREYYLTQDVTGPCTITASQATTILKGNLVSTSTGYTVTGNIVGNGNHINLQNITVTGTVDSDGGNITLSSNITVDGGINSQGGNISVTNSILDGELNTNGGAITVSRGTLLNTIFSAGGNISISNSTTTDVYSTTTTNGGNAGNITVATSTTAALFANGANGSTNGGNAGNITITNSFGTPISSVITANGGNSTSCGNGGNAGNVTINSSTYGTVTNTGGASNNTGCPGNSVSPGSSGSTVTVGGGYTAPQSSAPTAGTPALSTNSTTGGGTDSFFVRNIAPLIFNQTNSFGLFDGINNAINTGNTIIPSIFKDFNIPAALDFRDLPKQFLNSVSNFLFNENNKLELFKVKSDNKSITTSVKYNEDGNSVTQSMSAKTNQAIEINLNTTESILNGMFNGTPVQFIGGYVSITTPAAPGTYLLTVDNSPVTLSVEVTEPVEVVEDKKQGFWAWFKNLFVRLYNWLF